MLSLTLMPVGNIRIAADAAQAGRLPSAPQHCCWSHLMAVANDQHSVFKELFNLPF